MNIRLLNQKRLSISLSKKDMDDYCLTFESLDYQNPVTKKVLHKLLNFAESQILPGQTDFSCTNKRLLIEAYPDSYDGCILYFTINSVQNFKPHCNDCEQSSVAVMFDSCNAVIDAVCALSNRFNKLDMCSSLLKLDVSYGLIILFPQEELIAFLAPYAIYMEYDPIKIAYIAEHGVIMIAEQAISQLAAHFR